MVSSVCLVTDVFTVTHDFAMFLLWRAALDLLQVITWNVLLARIIWNFLLQRVVSQFSFRCAVSDVFVVMRGLGNFRCFAFFRICCLQRVVSDVLLAAFSCGSFRCEAWVWVFFSWHGVSYIFVATRICGCFYSAWCFPCGAWFQTFQL